MSVKAAPAIIKSAVMGGVLFSSFETMNEFFYQQWSHYRGGEGGGGGDSQVVFPTLFALTAGGGSGCLHGLSYTLWDHIGIKLFESKNIKYVDKINAKVSFRNLLSGTMLSHTLVHGALFGSYEATKRSSLALIGLHTEHDTSRVEGA